MKKNPFTLLSYFLSFKNPWTVFKFRNGNFKKGKLVRVIPWKGEPFYVTRKADFWLIEKVLNKETVLTEQEFNLGPNFFLEKNIYLRQATSDTFTYKEIFINQCYKESLKNINPKSIIIDIGAHIGLFSLYCASHCKKIIAFEAHKRNYEMALKNIASAQNNNIELHHKAVWSKSGELLSICEENEQLTGRNYLSKNSNPAALLSNESSFVESISLEDIFTKYEIENCDLIKMDIEGAEYAVIYSTHKRIFERIKAICLEYHPDLEKIHAPIELAEHLKSFGFFIKKQEINYSTGLLFANK